MTGRFQIYLESGSKRTFASALDWPGWARPGRTESQAIEALLAYGPKYQAILQGAVPFTAPTGLEQLSVVERLPGTSGTDFGALSVPPSVDQERSCTPAELQRFEAILRAGWRAFDDTVKSAKGKKLTTGPRGGGRSLSAIVKHVVEAEGAYLGAVGWKAPRVTSTKQLAANREAVLAAITASAAGEIPLRGPRGGVRWTARYFVRRVAWHVIAHVWEIERRVTRPSD